MTDTRPAKKTTTKRAPAKKAASPDQPAEPGAPDTGSGLTVENTQHLSRRGRVIRDALSAAGLPPFPDWPDSPEGMDAIWACLTAPFDPEDIERKPQPVLRGDTDKGRCEDHSHYCADGHPCGGWHARAVHLDYVGHAGITTRLNEVVGPAGWDFTPYTHNEDGTPWMTAALFVGRLTILGVEKWDLAANFTSPQEAYGDCLRRCAMRFGIGTYLWSKSERAAATAQGAVPQPVDREDVSTPDLLARLDRAAAGQGIDRERITAKWREQHGGIDTAALDGLAPWNLLPLVESIEAYIAAQAALAPKAGPTS
jgi:hypothetical protein